MANELLEKPVVFEVNGEEVKLSGNTVKNYLVSGNGDVTDQELVMFINLCKFQKLNPFLNEAYLVKFKDKNGGTGKPAQIIVSKEAFMKRAESHPKYDGFEAGIIVEREGALVEIEGAIKMDKDKLVGGWALVYRKDRERATNVKISFKEFSKGQATWNAMPLNMIRKTAIVNAMREAFPDHLGAMYTEEESQDLTIRKDVTEADNVQEEINQNANQEVIDIDPEVRVNPQEAQRKMREVEPEPEVTKEPMSNPKKDVVNPGF